MIRRCAAASAFRSARPMAAAAFTATAAFRSTMAVPSASPAWAQCQPQVQHRAFSHSSRQLARVGGQRSGTGSTTESSGWSVMPNFSPSTGSNTSGQSQADALTGPVRQHLFRVYNLLAMGIGAASIGSLAMMMTPLGKMVPFWFPMIGGLGCLLWMSFRPPASLSARLGLFFAFTTLEGMAIAPVVKVSLSAGVLGSALVLTGAVFAGFSAAALVAPRASMLALQGPLFGCLIGMMAISVLNMFYPMAFAHSLLLYGGLAVFSLFIATDTQAMIERASCGGSDHVMDATQLFINVVNIFVRIASILRGE